MELKTKDGFNMVSEDELKRLHELSHFLPVVRNSVSKAWRMLDKFQKLLEAVGGKDEKVIK